MDNLLISVIVPVYNTEKYLGRCVDSIINQTYTNLEIILVDDGSPDNSPAICDEYAKKDQRVKVIHKENGGLSSARNAGLDIAKGDFISFIDSDDFINRDMYKVLIDALGDSDIASVQFKTVKDDVIADDKQNITTKTVYGLDYLKNICIRTMSETVWDKLFKRDLIGKLRFDKTRLNEDFLFLSQILLKNPTVCCVDFVGYYYFVRAGSISRSGYGKSLRDSLYNAEFIATIIDKNVPNLTPYIRAYYVYQARTIIIVMTKEQFKNEKEIVQRCRVIIKENKKYIKKSFLKFKDKLFCYVFKDFPYLAKFIALMVYKKK